ncbi:MAG: Undecaprenyl-phosphate 4-deoxy-4-formamido-L-arabinose transferase [Planctomycetes bacterium]|nr:Undecaprenyl-phosphate 4-deoxy-4-formamido-L-arabinose transferase [Planctomycetota bacterium]
MNRPRLSVVIPAYNESRRLPPTLAAVRAWAESKPFAAEVVIVDDGSSDGTADVARAALAGIEHRVLVHERNRGKGAGIRTGMCAARGEFVLFSDADLSTPIEEADRFLEEHAKGAPVVIGTRKSAGANVLRRQHPVRENMGKVFTWLSNRLVCRGISDFTCGFKSFRADACARIFPYQREDGWAYDSEILYLAQARGFPVKELPVRWTNDPSTRVRLLRDAIGSFAGLMRIRGRAAFGSYRETAAPAAAADAGAAP